eukprot:549192-Prymnesium_polylepis.1
MRLFQQQRTPTANERQARLRQLVPCALKLRASPLAAGRCAGAAPSPSARARGTTGRPPPPVSSRRARAPCRRRGGPGPPP